MNPSHTTKETKNRVSKEEKHQGVLMVVKYFGRKKKVDEVLRILPIKQKSLYTAREGYVWRKLGAKL